MAEDSIFGRSVNLPSVPGISSSCEVELLKLTTEIDMVVSKKYQVWKKELDAQKQENEYLRTLLKTSQNEAEKLRKEVAVLENSQTNMTNRYENQLDELRQEIKNLQEMILNKFQLDDNNGKYREPSSQTESINSQLKYDIYHKEQQIKQTEASHQRLLKIITDLEQTLASKDKLLKESQKKEEKLMKEIEMLRQFKSPTALIDHTSVEQLINSATENVWKKESKYREQLKKSINDDIAKLEEKLRSTTF